MKKLVICMKWGTRYGPDYVNRLWRAVRRHTRGPVQLVCFTDDVTGIVKGVDCRPLPKFEGVRADLAAKPWRKLSLWQKNLGKDLTGRDALVLDVDLVVVGSLDGFWAYKPGKFAVWENPSKPGSDVGNTSVFRFKVGSHPEIYQHFMADPVGLYERAFRIEQEYISAVLGTGKVKMRDGRPALASRAALEEPPAPGGAGGLARVPYPSPAYKSMPDSARARRNPAARDGIWWGQGEQVFWPRGWVVSFKEDLLPPWPRRLWQVATLPSAAKVVAFHGKPDPDEAAAGRWPEKRWWKRWYKRLRPVGWVAENWR
jgi:hypothetical protein